MSCYLDKQKLQKQRECFARLFAQPYLDVGAIETITAEDRAALIEITDSCLSHDSHQYHAHNGSTIVLLNPNERTYTLLQGNDGILFLPRYRLQELSPEPTTVDMLASR